MTCRELALAGRADQCFPIYSVESPDRYGAASRWELELVILLVDALAASFDAAKYRDTYRENLYALDKPDKPVKSFNDVTQTGVTTQRSRWCIISPT